MWVVLPRAAETYIYISSSLSLFISLLLSIFLSSCNIFGMLRMDSDSICYESPEVACNTGAGTSLRVPGKISVPIAAKHIHLLALFSFPFRHFFHNKIFNPLQPSPKHTIIIQKKTLKTFRFLGRYYGFYITTNTRKRGKGGKYSAQKNKTWLEKYLTPSWR